MVRALVVVCTGNICRSPLAEAVLRGACPELELGSAGLHALVGEDVDPAARAAARELGLEIPAHRARQFDAEIGRAADVIIVMEKRQRDEIAVRWPELTGKTFLLGHFEGGREIPDPYLGPADVHREVAAMILESAGHWARQLEALG